MKIMFKYRLCEPVMCYDFKISVTLIIFKLKIIIQFINIYLGAILPTIIMRGFWMLLFVFYKFWVIKSEQIGKKGNPNFLLTKACNMGIY